MAKGTNNTDSYISMVLGLNGRVRPADLQALPEDARRDALSAFLDAHAAEMELHFVGDDLIAGALSGPEAPAASAPVASMPLDSETNAEAQPADLTADGRSAIDLLLGDYDGVAPTPAAREPVEELFDEPELGSVTSIAAGQAAPSSAAPSATSSVATWPAGPREKGSYGWLLWWIPTLLLPLVGGAAAWFFLRRKREFAARAMLTIGLVLGLFASVMWLRYAEQLAAINEQRSATTVIVVPSK